MRQIFYYIHTGHRFGLDRFRRAVAIIRELDFEVTLLCNDYRIASASREYGIKKAVGIDSIKNIANIAMQGDVLIYDSPEGNETQLMQMIEYFSVFIRLSDNPNDRVLPNEYLISPYLKGMNVCHAWPVASLFFEENFKKYENVLFYGDDDYERELPQKSAALKTLGIELLMGFYYFSDYAKELKNCFPRIYDSKEYENIVASSKQIITSSAQCALEALASGSKPIFWQRDDYSKNLNTYLLSYSIPVVTHINDVEKLLSQEISYKKIENEMPKIKVFIEKLISKD